MSKRKCLHVSSTSRNNKILHQIVFRYIADTQAISNISAEGLRRRIVFFFFVLSRTYQTYSPLCLTTQAISLIHLFEDVKKSVIS